MIDPVRVTNFRRNSSELEEFLLFCISVAGKNATTTASILDKLLDYGLEYCDGTPFEIIKKLNNIENLPALMKSFGFGCYFHKSRSFLEAANSGLDLNKCSTNDLEKIYGIGMKTSRYFLLHSRQNAHVACLDTHILRWLSKHSGVKVPKQTPTGKKYQELEQIFLKVCEALQIEAADLDLKIWNMSRGNNEKLLVKGPQVKKK